MLIEIMETNKKKIELEYNLIFFYTNKLTSRL